MNSPSSKVPKLTIYKRPSSQVFWFSVSVPTDLRASYGKAVVRETTHSRTRPEAELNASKRYAAILEDFTRLRRSLNPQRLEVVSEPLAQTLADAIRRRTLAGDDLLRQEPRAAQAIFSGAVAGLPDFMADATAGILERLGLPGDIAVTIAPPAPPQPHVDPLGGVPASVRLSLRQHNATTDSRAAEALADGNLRAILPHVEHEAKQLGFTFDTSAPGAVEALRLCLTAWRQARADVVRRDAGDVVETPKASQTAPAVTVRPTSPGSPRTLRELFPLWEASKSKKPDTVRAAMRALVLFEKATDNPDIQQITRAEGVAFRAWLLSQPTTSKTARDRFDNVKALLNFAAQDLELMPKNPWRGLRVEFTTTTPGRPWSDEEITELFGLPLFLQFSLPTAKMAGGAAAYWIPVLGMFTGARISELAQLMVADVQKVDGVYLLGITSDGDEQTVKTEAGRRLVPLHPEVLRLGFLDYVQSIKDAKHARLFPLVPWRDEKPGGLFSTWFTGFKRTVKRDKALPRFHDFRRTVRTRLSEALVAEPTIDALVGHAISGSTGAKVYTHRSPRALKAALDKLSYPGLVLPRVYPAPSSRPSGSKADPATA